MHKSMWCTTGAHDRCRDGAALSCVCNCGHQRFRKEADEQRSWYQELAADEAEMDRRIIDQLREAK
jgi:hypothetical protein